MWSAGEQCGRNPDFMTKYCKKSCGLCKLLISFNYTLQEFSLENQIAMIWNFADKMFVPLQINHTNIIFIQIGKVLVALARLHLPCEYLSIHVYDIRVAQMSQTICLFQVAEKHQVSLKCLISVSSILCMNTLFLLKFENIHVMWMFRCDLDLFI